MTRDDIIRMAKQADDLTDAELGSEWNPDRENLRDIHFAALVAAAEREAIGDIILDYAERDDLSDSDESLLKYLFELIRARGE